jgi:lipopolysaccharide transport system permease protein
LNFLLDPIRSIWRHRELLFGTLVVELRSTYAGSVLGLSWVVVAPLMLMIIYASVYLLIFRVTLPGLRPIDYVFLTSTGLAAFVTFGNSLGAGTNSVLRNKQVLLNAVFPAELLPVRAVLTACPPLVFGGLVLMALSPIFGQGGWKVLLVPVIALFQIMFMCGVAWILSLLTLLIRDIQHLIQYVTTVLLIVTPIGFTINMVPAGIALMVKLNPLAYYVLSYQALIVFDRWPEPKDMAVIVVMSTTTFLAGYWIFQKAKFAFYDYV